MSATSTVHCIVAYATSDEQYLWSVALAPGASIEDALAAARAQAPALDVPWDKRAGRDFR